MKWITDANGNKCSVEYCGTEKDAQAALDSLKNCKALCFHLYSLSKFSTFCKLILDYRRGVMYTVKHGGSTNDHLRSTRQETEPSTNQL
jgi:hypothetical protein